MKDGSLAEHRTLRRQLFLFLYIEFSMMHVGRRIFNLIQAVDVLKFTDSVYENAPGKYDVLWGSGGIEIVTKNLKDVVIWNPQAEAGAKIGDMEEGGWYVLHRYPGDCTTDHKYREKYICVEPGYVRGFVKLEAGQTWIGHQVLKVKV